MLTSHPEQVVTESGDIRVEQKLTMLGYSGSHNFECFMSLEGLREADHWAPLLELLMQEL